MNIPLRLSALERLPTLSIHRVGLRIVARAGHVEIALRDPVVRRDRPEIVYLVDGAKVPLDSIDPEAWTRVTEAVAIAVAGVSSASNGRDLGGGWSIRRAEPGGGA
jgi:hypothetical protein